LQRAWTVHTVESWRGPSSTTWLRNSDPARRSGVEGHATYGCFQFDDASLVARIQIDGAEHDYLVHRVKIG
jgi:hypothetical protein